MFTDGAEISYMVQKKRCRKEYQKGRSAVGEDVQSGKDHGSAAAKQSDEFPLILYGSLSIKRSKLVAVPRSFQ
ncbi:hypothetical protein Y032_0150g2774 [Ancylostoma ceylanicum]|uniref:Uncharacterized protein n=1 Tax=Ancylostoma ceylanicum TaxID=53326 RepID=A0A016T1L1_9BILA|nr:hypothetical protein Y032_0150g2774 [Ancylostoma ceylanicum]